jgi:LPS-assembly lipoprotein
VITRRRLLTRLLPVSLAVPSVLTGCGWEPLYADPQTAAGNADLRAIKVNPIGERIGQNLEMGLRNSFNPNHEPTKPLYLLKVALTQTLQDLGIQSQGLGTRGEVQITASYQLLEFSSGKGLQTASIHANDSFDIQANGYSTVVAEDDAKTRCVEDLRREIVARLTLFMQNKPKTS